MSSPPEEAEFEASLQAFNRLLVSDFDGTITAFDFFERALARIDTRRIPDYWGQYVAGRLSHFEALKGIFSHVGGGESSVMEVARETRPDPQLSEAVRTLHAAGWGLVIVSAGCQWYIERLLAESGVQVPIVSNPGTIAGDGTLQMRLPTESPFYCAEIGIDKLSVVKWAQDRFADVAFAGDGRPDEAPARAVSPQQRFARGWLAEQFERDGTEFHKFERWSEIAVRLTEEDAP
jgi:2-hydroxy-3-keto-5-methylthiopentenyl-1-phosphate phosphatase